MGPASSSRGFFCKMITASLSRAGGKRAATCPISSGARADDDLSPAAVPGVALLRGPEQEAAMDLHATTVRRGRPARRSTRRRRSPARGVRRLRRLRQRGRRGADRARPARPAASRPGSRRHRHLRRRHFHSERRLGLVGDNFNKADVIGRLQGPHRARPQPLLHHRRHHPAQRAAAVRRSRHRRLRASPTTATSPTR